MITADRYGFTHGSCAHYVIKDKYRHAFVATAFKRHVKLTPSINRAKWFLQEAMADEFLNRHYMHKYQYKIMEIKQ
ncbi:hypothetical protein ACKP2L_05360 [Oenococcus alcoholitolerans]|uniref:hypothetical protein n=1 Tax=Oenococcus alcoholitolerans TaxID=931074 RepID=UPI003F70A0DA